jgi:hypothetical protein
LRYRWIKLGKRLESKIQIATQHEIAFAAFLVGMEARVEQSVEFDVFIGPQQLQHRVAAFGVRGGGPNQVAPRQQWLRHRSLREPKAQCENGFFHVK